MADGGLFSNNLEFNITTVIAPSGIFSVYDRQVKLVYIQNISRVLEKVTIDCETFLRELIL